MTPNPLNPTECDTVKIIPPKGHPAKGKHKFITINKEDFDPAEHTKYKPKKKKKGKKKDDGDDQFEGKPKKKKKGKGKDKKKKDDD